MVSEVPEVGQNWWMFVVLGVVCVVAGGSAAEAVQAETALAAA